MKNNKTKTNQKNQIQSHAMRRGIIWGGITSLLLAVVSIPAIIINGLNYSYGGNAVVNQGNYDVISPNTESHAGIIWAITFFGSIIVVIVGGFLIGFWQYKRNLNKTLV